MMAMYREQAETNVKTRLALEKIVELEQIEPAEDEIEAEYAKLAENYKMDIDKIKGVIPAADIKANLAMRKAIDLLKEHSVAKKKKGDPQEKKPQRKRNQLRSRKRNNFDSAFKARAACAILKAYAARVFEKSNCEPFDVARILRIFWHKACCFDAYAFLQTQASVDWAKSSALM